MDRAVTIYMDSVAFEDDDGTVRIIVTDKRGKTVEIIGCVPRFVEALKGAQKFWETFQRKCAEAHIANLPRRRKASV
jgi:hypothetical protein